MMGFCYFKVFFITYIGGQKMNSGKIVAIITGAISIILSLGYLILVQILDFRGDMVPAPMEALGLLGLSKIH